MKDRITTIMSGLSLAFALTVAVTFSLKAETESVPVSGSSSNGEDLSPGGGPVSTPVGEVPLASEAMLDAYALALVSRIDVSMGANSAVVGFYTGIPYEGAVADPVALKAAAESVIPRISVGNVKDDSVYYNVNFRAVLGKVNAGLFYGSDQKKPVLGSNGWTLPRFTVAIKRSDWIPWPKRGVTSAHMIIRNERGDIVDYYYFDQDNRIDRENGILWLGSQHTKRRGELYVNVSDGEGWWIEIYDLRTGKAIAPTPIVSSGVEVELPVVTLAVNSPVIMPAVGQDWNRHLYYVSYTSNQTVQVGYGPVPVGASIEIWMIDAEDLLENPDSWTRIEPNQYEVQAGRRLFFRYEWGPINTNPIYRPPYPYPVGEKG